MKEMIKRERKEIVKRKKSLTERQKEVLEKRKAESLPVISEILEGREREFVILDCDNSGSMVGEKLKKLKEAILEFILAKEKIDPRDQTALVTFGGSSKKWFDFTNDRKLIREKVSELKADGGTPMGEGLTLCREIFKERKIIGQPRIVLLSDGQANGPGDPQRSIDEAKALKELRVIIDTIGIGEGRELDEELLKEIAEITGGKYLHVRDIYQLPKIYVKLAEKKMLPSSQSSQAKFFLNQGK